MRKRTSFHTATLVLAVVSAAACGGSTPAANEPPRAGGVASSSPGDGRSVSSTDPSVTPGPTSSPEHAIAAPVRGSTLNGDLAALSLDPGALPSLDKLPPETLRQVMKTFSKALGTKCDGCHDPNDFRAPTPNKKIASRMWEFYVRGLATEEGAPLYCDSCHDGKMRFLDRHDEKGLRAWMDANFVSKLKRKDGRPHSCESCHGDPFQPKILASWTRR